MTFQHQSKTEVMKCRLYPLSRLLAIPGRSRQDFVRRLGSFLIMFSAVVSLAEITDATIYWADECLTALESADGNLNTASHNLNAAEISRDDIVNRMASWLASNTSDPNYSYVYTWRESLINSLPFRAISDEVTDAWSDVAYARGLLANMSTNNFSEILRVLKNVDSTLTNIYNEVAIISNYIDKAGSFIDYYSNRVAKVEFIRSYDVETSIAAAFSFVTNSFGYHGMTDWVNGDYLFDWFHDMTEYGEPIMKQILKQDSDGLNIDLTNEGYFLYKNYIQNERDFYLKLNMQNMLEEMLGRTNLTVDISSISNYLYVIQQPFYGSFNDLLRQLKRQVNSWGNWNPYNNFGDNLFYTVTNFYWKASSLSQDPEQFELNDVRNTFQTYQNLVTNPLMRLEFHLMNMQGLFPSQGDFNQLTEGRTKSSLQYQFDELSNGFQNVTGSMSTLSNRFASISEALRGLVTALDLREYKDHGNSTTLTLAPGFQPFNGSSFEVPSIEIELDDLDDLSDLLTFSHGLFNVLWHILFSIGAGLALYFYFRQVGLIAIFVMHLISSVLSK